MITHKYPPSIGGMQKQSYELIKNLEPHANVHKIAFESRYPKILFFLIVVPWAWIRLLLNRNIRLIHANDGLMALIITPLLLTKRKLSVTIHGLDVVFPLGFYQWWVRRYLSRFHLIITVSEETRKECISRGIPSSKISFIPNGVELKTGSFPLREDAISNLEKRLGKKLNGVHILTSIGRPIKRKGFSWFVENVASKLEIPFVYLIIGPKEKNPATIRLLSRILPYPLFRKISLSVGLGLDEFEFTRKIKAHALEEKVLSLGKISDAELTQILQVSDLFIMPNIRVEGDYEGFGLVALEASAMGTVCLASQVDGIPSAVKHGENGLLLPPGDADPWINEITTLLNDPPNLQVLGQKFRQYTRAHLFTWEMMSREYLLAFQKIV